MQIGGERSADRFSIALLAVLLVAVAAAQLWGIRKDLPWAPGGDEIRFTSLAGQVAATGNLNPGWFGHPGATTIYPLAALFDAFEAWKGAGEWLDADPMFGQRLAEDPGTYLLIGRLLSSVYALACLPLVFAIGNRAFAPPVGIIAAFLAALPTVILDHAQIVRTDTAGLFFALLSLWLCLRMLAQPGTAARIAAGLAIGAAIASRYLLVVLAAVYAAAELILWLRRPPEERSAETFGRAAVIGGAAAIAGFMICAPYVLLDFGQVLKNLAHERRETHPGADGLGFVGNLAYYLTFALPAGVPLPAQCAALVAAALAIARRRAEPLLLLLFGVVFTLGISLPALHWERWLIPALPVVAIFAAAGVVEIVSLLLRRVPATPVVHAGALALAVLLVAAPGIRRFVAFAEMQGRPNTLTLAREWFLESVNPTVRIVGEAYTAPLQKSPFQASVRFSLADSPDIAAYERSYDYAMASSGIYGRYFAEPKRYPAHVAFYREAFRRWRLIKKFGPGRDARGPVIRVYALRTAPVAAPAPRVAPAPEASGSPPSTAARPEPSPAP